MQLGCKTGRFKSGRGLSRLACGAIVISLIAVTGCQPPATSAGGVSLTPKDLFRLHCSSCHGDGSGNGHVAATLKVRPRNLKHAEWQRSVTDQHIIQVIRDGGAAVKLSPEMPAFGDKISAQQLQDLMVYLRVLGR